VVLERIQSFSYFGLEAVHHRNFSVGLTHVGGVSFVFLETNCGELDLLSIGVLV